jgi:hypothetical protein
MSNVTHLITGLNAVPNFQEDYERASNDEFLSS